jgi:HK97 family phage major capsid protein
MNKLRKFYRAHPILGFFLACVAVLAIVALKTVIIPTVGAMGVLSATGSIMIPEAELQELRSVVSGLKEYKDLLPALKDVSTVEGGWAAIKALPATLKGLITEKGELEKEVNRLKKQALTAKKDTGVRWVGEIPFVTDDCARSLTACFVSECLKVSEKCLGNLVPNAESRERVINLSCEILGVETRTALTTTQIPVPTIYMPQVIELVYKYGQARQYATVFPLGNGTVKLPRLAAGEDDFGYLGAGAAGMSQTVNEKRVTAELVTFTANKFGGIVRIPTELEEDTFIPLGQFLARYIARQLAKMEDKTLFLADGSATYGNATGIGKYCDTNTSYLLQLTAGNVNPSDATLDDFRNLRSKVSAAVLSGGYDAAYYLNPTWEPFLVKFNKYPNFIVFQRNPDGSCTLDGWPVRWIGVTQAFQTTAAPSAYCAFFGALSYWYLGERGQARIEVSREVYFATDELAMRALERIDVEAMAVDAVATLKTAAA